MPQIQLNDEVFKVARQRAEAAGYDSVEEYIADIVIQDSPSLTNDQLDHLFTPERLADIERISAEAKAGGKTYSMAEVEAHMQNKRKAWQANQST